MNDETLKELERRFWLGDAGFYETHLAEDCVMVFPEPAGIMGRQAIIQSLDGAPRWQEVEFGEAAVRRLSASAWLLTYSATASRGRGGAPYRTLAGSVYLDEDGRLLLTFHQQTPLPPG